MTEPAPAPDLGSLEPLEPLDGGGPGQGGFGDSDAALQALRSGLGAPGFNPYCRDKTFYRFLFAGVVMIVGTLMPFSADLSRAGFQSMTGGFVLILGIAMVWTWWAAIHHNRSTNASLKWLLLCAFPLIGGIWNMAAFDAEAALVVAKANRWLPDAATTSVGWKGLLGDMFGGLAKRNAERLQQAETFWRLFGPGQFYVTLGALIAELGFLGGIVGGHAQNKAEQKAKQMAAAERKRK